jgi:hypothetical protein
LLCSLSSLEKRKKLLLAGYPVSVGFDDAYLLASICIASSPHAAPTHARIAFGSTSLRNRISARFSFQEQQSTQASGNQQS